MTSRQKTILESIQFQIRQLLKKIETDSDITASVYVAVYRPQLDALFIQRDRYM